jgi:hypothetical protein
MILGYLMSSNVRLDSTAKLVSKLVVIICEDFFTSVDPQGTVSLSQMPELSFLERRSVPGTRVQYETNCDLFFIEEI